MSSNRYKNRGASAPGPKRYYRRARSFPEGIDRLESELRLPVSEEQIERWVDELFLGGDRNAGGGLKQLVGYIILKYGAWEQAMSLARCVPDINSPVCGQGGADFALNEDFVPGTVQTVRPRRKHRGSVKDAPPSPQKTGFRAAWALEWAYEQAEPDDLPEWFFDRVADDLCASQNGGVHRIYAKIVCDMMRFGGVRPSETQVEKLAEKCFGLVIDPRTKTATKFWCLEVLTRIAPRAEWVAEELPETVRRISEAPDCPPGMRVATREILKRLKTVKNG
jgi:hypothetical protein